MNKEERPQTAEASGSEDVAAANAESDKKHSAKKAQQAGILPKISPSDASYTWGDRDESKSHDDWLRENKPPHWG